MPATQPTIYLNAGCNGEGKTTFAKQLLPHEVKCLNFLNADLIAHGLLRFDTRTAAIKAGRLLLTEFRAFVAGRKTFALESTLSGKTYVSLLRQAQHQGFRIHLLFSGCPTRRWPSRACVSA